jgi:hypothetical protein
MKPGDLEAAKEKVWSDPNEFLANSFGRKMIPVSVRSLFERVSQFPLEGFGFDYEAAIADFQVHYLSYIISYVILGSFREIEVNNYLFI